MIKHLIICLCCILVPLRVAFFVSEKADVRAQQVVQEATNVACRSLLQLKTTVKRRTEGLEATVATYVQDGVDALASALDTAHN